MANHFAVTNGGSIIVFNPENQRSRTAIVEISDTVLDFASIISRNIINELEFNGIELLLLPTTSGVPPMPQEQPYMPPPVPQEQPYMSPPVPQEQPYMRPPVFQKKSFMPPPVPQEKPIIPPSMQILLPKEPPQASSTITQGLKTTKLKPKKSNITSPKEGKHEARTSKPREFSPLPTRPEGLHINSPKAKQPNKIPSNSKEFSPLPFSSPGGFQTTLPKTEKLPITSFKAGEQNIVPSKSREMTALPSKPAILQSVAPNLNKIKDLPSKSQESQTAQKTMEPTQIPLGLKEKYEGLIELEKKLEKLPEIELEKSSLSLKPPNHKIDPKAQQQLQQLKNDITEINRTSEKIENELLNEKMSSIEYWKKKKELDEIMESSIKKLKRFQKQYNLK